MEVLLYYAVTLIPPLILMLFGFPMWKAAIFGASCLSITMLSRIFLGMIDSHINDIREHGFGVMKLIYSAVMIVAILALLAPGIYTITSVLTGTTE